MEQCRLLGKHVSLAVEHVHCCLLYSLLTLLALFDLLHISDICNADIILFQRIDFESMGDVKELTCTVKVSGPCMNPSVGDCTSETSVVVTVTDINDNAPVICPTSGSCMPTQTVKVSEGVKEDSVIAEVQATDADSGVNAEFE